MDVCDSCKCKCGLVPPPIIKIIVVEPNYWTGDFWIHDVFFFFKENNPSHLCRLVSVKQVLNGGMVAFLAWYYGESMVSRQTKVAFSVEISGSRTSESKKVVYKMAVCTQFCCEDPKITLMWQLLLQCA